MSPRSNGFRAHALTAEASARAANDPEVSRKFMDVGRPRVRCWHFSDMPSTRSNVRCRR
jgi:hypothetical protein